MCKIDLVRRKPFKKLTMTNFPPKTSEKTVTSFQNGLGISQNKVKSSYKRSFSLNKTMQMDDYVFHFENINV